MPRRTVLVLAMLAVLLGAVGASVARADGDPGSDVLVFQPLFVAADAGAPVAGQIALSDTLRAAAAHGVAVRVAVIAHRADLGAVTALWGRPQRYARFLAAELSLSYRGRLVVVMPDGIGVTWVGHRSPPLRAVLTGISIAPGGRGLLTAAGRAASRLAGAAGVRLQRGRLPAGHAHGAPAPAPGASTAAHRRGTRSPGTASRGDRAPGAARPAGNAAGTADQPIGIAIAVLLTIAAALLILGDARRRAPGSTLPSGGRLAAGVRAHWLSTAVGGGLALLVVAAAVVALTESGPSSASLLATNPSLDSGTMLSGRPAPNFTLYDQTGHRVSLRSFRGRVTLLAFNDSECTTICPLTTQAMLEAKRMLGRAGDRLQLLGVDANPKAIQIEDVLSYTQLHGLTGRWKFLTGSLAQLRRVWRAYGVQAAIQHGLISHTPAIYVIDPRGRLRELYMTQQSYASLDQFAQILARTASRLLPGHPRVGSDLSYAPRPSTPPDQVTTLPRVGGGRVTLGPGRPRLSLFFDTWDREVSGLPGELDRFNAYAARAGAQRLPALTAIDEGSVEPSPRALPAFLGALPRPLRYPVAVDATGRVADGDQVQGVPWLVLTSASGRIVWYDEIVDARWPSVGRVVREVRAALRRSTAGSATAADLIGSPRPLAALHRQAGRLLGASPALMARIRSLRGYPIVVNAWASWCEACQAETGLLATASRQFGRQVAFLGADANDPAADGAAFLRAHPVSYPSYSVRTTDLQALVSGGIEGLPTTIFIGRDGRVTAVHSGEYASQGSLDADIKAQALTAAPGG